jgi:hypothetical protein
MSAVVSPDQRLLILQILIKSPLPISRSGSKISSGFKEIDQSIRRKCAQFASIAELTQSPTANTTFI